MSDMLYNLIFSGELEAGQSQADVCRVLESLFEFEGDEPLDFFSGESIVLGESMNEATAQAFQQALAAEGATAHLEAVQENENNIQSRRKVKRRSDTERRAQARDSSVMPDRRHADRRKNV